MGTVNCNCYLSLLYRYAQDSAALFVIICNCWYSVATKFPYLVQKGLQKGQELRRVAQFDWQIIESSCDAPFEAAGLSFTPLPVVLCLSHSITKSLISILC